MVYEPGYTKAADTRMMKDMEVKCPQCGRQLEEHRRDGESGYSLRCVGTYLHVCSYEKVYKG